MITILIADDHPVVRSGVRSLLREDREMRVAAEAQSGAELLHQIAGRHFDVILLDIGLPDGSGIDLLPQLQREAPATRIVMFTNADQEVGHAIAAGAAGFVTKDAPAEKLRAAIKGALTGERVISDRAARRLVPGDADVPQQPAAYEQLSHRELEILLKLVGGMRPKEIALHLQISDKTVHTHCRRLKRKLGVADSRELMLYAVRNGLVDWAQ